MDKTDIKNRLMQPIWKSNAPPWQGEGESGLWPLQNITVLYYAGGITLLDLKSQQYLNFLKIQQAPRLESAGMPRWLWLKQ